MPVGIVDHQRSTRPATAVDGGLQLLDQMVLDKTLHDNGDRSTAEPHMFGNPGTGGFFQFPFYTSEDILTVDKFQIVVWHLLHTSACPFQTQVKVRFGKFPMGLAREEPS